MQRHPTIGLDLPLKMLVWESADSCFLSYRCPWALASAHGVSEDDPVPARMAEFLAALADSAAVADASLPG